MNTIFGNNMFMAEKTMDSLWARQQVTLNNIANNDTPGYKAQYVTFEDEFRRRLTAGRERTSGDIADTIAGSRYHVHNTRDELARMDENNVNTDVESVELARTALHYQFMLNAFNSDVNRLRTVIKG